MIRIETPARLHLGLLDTNGGLGRLYGSIGVAIQKPNIALQAAPAEGLIVEGLESERIAIFARRFLDRYPIPGGAHLSLKEHIPNHVGLGSGTQLALAVGSALAQLGGWELSPQEIAMATGRGTHSGIGIAAFQSGGFVLDGGHRTAAPGDRGGSLVSEEKWEVPPVLMRHPFPDNWWFVVAIPEVEAGISGESENTAFRTLPRAPESLVERISWLILMKLLPSLVEQDITNFGQALTEIQNLVGDCFAAVQGGRFANTISHQLIRRMKEWGAEGSGQSSWGPAVYGLVQGEDQALQLVKAVQEFLSRKNGGQVFPVQGDNQGMRIKFVQIGQ